MDMSPLRWCLGWLLAARPPVSDIDHVWWVSLMVALPGTVTATYSCFVRRCPSYSRDYDSCQQMPDPDDPTCCVVPVCTPTPEPYITPYPGATLAPNLIPPRIPVIPPGLVTGGNTTGNDNNTEYNNNENNNNEDL